LQNVRRLLLLASTVVLVDTSFYAAITPLLPELTDQYGLSKAGAGVLAAAYPAGTFAGGLPGGLLAARWGVKPTVLLGLALMVVSSIGFAFANSVIVLDVARFVQGIGGAASWAGAMAWIAAAAPRDQRGQMIGSAMGAAIAGALLGPVIGVLADALGFEAVFFGVGLVGIGLMLWTARMPAAKPVGDGSLRGMWRALANHDIRLSLALITVPGLLFGTAGVLVPLRMDALGASAAAIGVTWLLGAGLEAIASPLAGRFSDRRGRMAPMLAGLAGAAVIYTLFPWPGSWELVAVVLIIGAPVVGLLWAPSMAMLSDGAEAVGLEQGLAFGLMNLTWATGQTLGNVGGAGLGQAAGDEFAFLLLAAMCVVVFTALRIRAPRPVTA
jgi:MFS family permease